MKKPLLFLCHRIPYPPNKGDKIRSFQLLKYLSEEYQIFLGTFIDDPDDWQYIENVKAYCQEVNVLKLNPTVSKIKSLTGLLTGKPLTEPYYYNANMTEWVEDVTKAKGIRLAVVFSSSMAQYIEDEKFTNLRRLIDFVDLDSDKWLQYSNSKNGLMKWIYRRESKELLELECRIAEKFDYSSFVSQKEVEFFRGISPVALKNIGYFNNGVDHAYFDPGLEFENPYPDDAKIIVFTGAMDYWANVDAVTWFAKNYFSKVRENIPLVEFYIVGANPSDDVKQLQQISNIFVTGKVPDIRPYLKYADISVAPLRIARGIQNKVLEAMAMSKLCLASPQAFEGINASDGEELLVVQNPDHWVEKVTEALTVKRLNIEQSARQCVIENYSWQANLADFAKHLNSD